MHKQVHNPVESFIEAFILGECFGMRFLQSGDTDVLVQFEPKIDLSVANQVWAFLQWLDHQRQRHHVRSIVDTLPGYCTVFIRLNPTMQTPKNFVGEIVDALAEAKPEWRSLKQPQGKVITLPVCYGGEYGPDLASVAEYHGLTEDQVVALHSALEYPVYFTGFLPSFPFLGGMPLEIATPRLAKPRLRVPSGSVGIANQQTGIYPLESPGGWRIIGRTPVRLFDLQRQNPFLLKPGDFVRFEPISTDLFTELASAVDKHSDQQSDQQSHQQSHQHSVQQSHQHSAQQADTQADKLVVDKS